MSLGEVWRVVHSGAVREATRQRYRALLEDTRMRLLDADPATDAEPPNVTLDATLDGYALEVQAKGATEREVVRRPRHQEDVAPIFEEAISRCLWRLCGRLFPITDPARLLGPANLPKAIDPFGFWWTSGASRMFRIACEEFAPTPNPEPAPQRR
jgi:hypothetical protein